MSELISRVVLIQNQKGLHARASAKFVACVRQYDANVLVEHNGQTAEGHSIMDLMMLAAGLGAEVEVFASGDQAQEALDSVCALIEQKFGEEI